MHTLKGMQMSICYHRYCTYVVLSKADLCTVSYTYISQGQKKQYVRMYIHTYMLTRSMYQAWSIILTKQVQL